MSLSHKLKRKAINDGKYFASTNNNFKLNIKPQCGYKMSFVPLHDLRCTIEVDSRAVVSLALVNKKSSILESYANKLPIMTINVSRLLYTIEAFALKNTGVNLTQQALEFYIKTDLKNRDKTLPPNHQFSQFLHRLKSSGYPEYIFDLAREMQLNVDYVIDSKVAARYIKIDGDINNQYSSSIGFITSIQDSNAYWYVKTTKAPIITQYSPILIA